jgi:hypothetical protein
VVISATFAANQAFGGTNGNGGASSFPGEPGRFGRTYGGGFSQANGSLRLGNVLLVAHHASGNGYGPVHDLGGNVSSDATLALPISQAVNASVTLSALSQPAGSTPTVAIERPGPAVGHGIAAMTLSTDQRGRPRPGPGRSSVDSGAVQGIIPQITLQPTDLIRTNGQSASFSVNATGDPLLTYRWQFFGTNLPATNSTLVLTNLQPAQFGTYSVAVSNAFGAVTSQAARLVLHATPQAPRLQPFREGQHVVGLQWLSDVGLVYVVESKTNLEPGAWVLETNLSGNGTVLRFSTVVTNAPRKFFRLRVD